MKARFLDPHGPLHARAARYVGAFALSAALAAFASAPVSAFIGFLFLLLPLVTLVPSHQRKAKDVELVTGPGWIDVGRAGLRRQRIRAQAVIGGSTAKTNAGVLLTLELKRRRAPVVLELASEAEVDEVRRALGIGHEGFGWLRWNSAWRGTTRAGFIGALLWGSAILAIPLAQAIGTAAEILVGGFAGLAIMVAFVLTLVDWFSFASQSAPTIGMDANGVGVRTDGGVRVLPYAAIEDVVIEPKQIVFVAAGERLVAKRARFAWGGDGLSDAAAAALASQVKSAAARARGLGKPKDDRAAQLEALRAAGDTPRAWLQRLDVLGRTLVAGAGYRGASLEPSDLWSVLEDPDADTELRVAAARVLTSAGLPDAKTRIDAAAAAAHDETAAKRIRIATDDDIEEACRELGRTEHPHRAS